MSGSIIAATDFKPRADRAIDRAIALGQQLGRNVTLFHARNLPVGKSGEAHGLDAKLAEVLPAGDHEIDFAYEFGNVPQVIAEFAEKELATLLLVGVARHNSFGDYVLGTAVDVIVRNTSRPVLVVKKRPQGDYSKIAIATDFSLPSRAAAIWAAEMFPEAKLFVHHAFTIPYGAWNKAEYVRREITEYTEHEMRSFLRSLPEDVQSRVTSSIEEMPLVESVNALIEREAIDLVVIGSHGETGFRHATIGSQANVLLSSTSADTVIIAPCVAGRE